MRMSLFIILLLIGLNSCGINNNNKVESNQAKAERIVLKHENENLPYIKGYQSVAFSQLTLVKTKGTPKAYKVIHKFRLGDEGYLIKTRYHLDLDLTRVISEVNL